MIYLKWLIWYESLQIKASLKISPTEQGAVYVWILGIGVNI